MTMINPSEECMERVYKEFGTTRAKVKEDVQVIKKWLQQQPHLPNVENDLTIESAFMRNKFRVEQAKENWDMYFTLKNTLPEFFCNRDPMLEEMQIMANLIHLAPFPRVTEAGYRVAITRIVTSGYSDFKHDNFFKLAFMMVDVAMKEDKCVGEIHIIDLKNFAVKNLPKLAMYDLRKAVSCLKAYHFRIKGIHFINAPSTSVLAVLLRLLKAVIKTKLLSRIHVHSTLDSLYKHVDRTILPLEYGGHEQCSVEEIASKWMRKVESQRDWFLEQEVIGKADESKRPKNPCNGVTKKNKSFRALDID